jgi:hypothetical protein
VKLKCAIPPRYFTDYLCFLKVEGKWQIAQKIFADRGAPVEAARGVCFTCDRKSVATPASDAGIMASAANPKFAQYCRETIANFGFKAALES